MRARVRGSKLKYWSSSSLTRLLSIATAALDRRAPISAKLVALLTVVYALSPIDLIPDFIPVLGWIDDLIIVPAGLWLVSRLMPPGLLQEHYERRVNKVAQRGS